MKAKSTRNILLFLLAFLGLGAIAGGGALIVSPSGDLLKMPLSLIEKSPFRSYLIPGIILFSVLGLVPCLVVFGLIKKPKWIFAEQFNFFKDMHWSWTFSIYTGFALIIWLQIEMEVLQSIYLVHTFYMFLAIAIIFVALLPQIRNQYYK
jgi:hypothetical protein